MECHFNFQKATISKIVGEFLCENLPNESEHIKRVISGKKFQYMEANQVLRSIMSALTASNTHIWSACKYLFIFKSQEFFLLVSHLRLSQWRDDLVVG